MSFFQKRRSRPAVLLALAAAALIAGCAQEEADPVQTDPAPQSTVQAPSIDTASASSDTASTAPESDAPGSDVPYVPTSPKTVARMLEMAEVTSQDTVYDLGSGDGRIVIAAAQQYGAHGVGIEIDAELVKKARKNAKEAGVADLVTFHQGDLFNADLSGATAVTLYLLPSVNMKLRPKLMRELEPGTPVVSHDFDMDDWEPDRTVQLNGDTVFRWTIPEARPDGSTGE